MKERILFALFAVLLIFNFPSISVAQVLKPDLMYCGTSARMGADLYLGTGPFNEISGCVPDADTQALLITVTGTIPGNGPAWLAYLNAGGVIISSKYNTNEIYNEIFGTGYLDTFPFGECKNNTMPSLKINPGDAFWVANPGLAETPVAITGCGSDNAVIAASESKVTALGGLLNLDGDDTGVVSFAVRYQELGVFWLLEADWHLKDPVDLYTDDSKNFMGVLIGHGADLPDLIFEDGFEE